MALNLVDKMVPWVAGDHPDAAVAICSQCSLVRNLADFAFPAACSTQERHTVQERILGSFEHAHLLERGEYFPIDELKRQERLLIAERRLIHADLARGGPASGVYVAQDQSVGIGVNGSDHLCLTMLGSGFQFQEVWTQLSALDDALGGWLDFAFDKRFGFLTSSLSHVGTGLKAAVILHLPAIPTSTSSVAGLVQMARQRRQAIHGLKATVTPPSAPGREKPVLPEEQHVGEAFYSDLTGALYGDVNEAQGDLYILTNLATLGASEEEVLFHLRRTANEIIALEQQSRAMLMSKERRHVEDRVCRALGVAQNARLLGFTEAVGLLSSLRLGVDTGLLAGFTLRDLNELLLAAQSAHLKVKAGRDCDEWTLSVERADLFRTRFATGT
jgi:protein arginine kinase